MVDTAGLRLDQAPPLHLPLRLLLTAPVFAAVAGVLLMVWGDQVFASRWTPAALAATHLIVIGFLGQAMCGALLQMLPVVAGAPVPGVRWVAPLVHAALAAGALLVPAGFLGAGSWTLVLGSLSAALGFLVFAGAAAAALARARGAPATVLALRLAVLALVPTVAIGVTLVAALTGWLHLRGFGVWVSTHLTWGLFGWVGLLILGVAYQVVPMFHVTPAYPRVLVKTLAPVLFAGLLAISLSALSGAGDLAWMGQGMMALALALFALATLVLQRGRARPRRDATLLHWWTALGAGIGAAIGWWMQAPDLLLGTLLLVGVGVGLPSAMLLKIVPFLCWFHLQQRQVATGRFEVRVPHMHALVPEGAARWQWALHLTALIVLAAASANPRVSALGGSLLLLAALWLGVLLATAAWRYRSLRAALSVPVEQGQRVRGTGVP